MSITTIAMPEHDHHAPHNEQPRYTAEAPRFASLKEQNEYMEQVYARLQADRAAAAPSREQAVDHARQEVGKAFGASDAQPTSAPRIVRPPRIARPPQTEAIPHEQQPVMNHEPATLPLETPALEMVDSATDAIAAAESHLQEVVEQRSQTLSVPEVLPLHDEPAETMIATQDAEQMTARPEAHHEQAIDTELSEAHLRINVIIDDITSIDSRIAGRVDAASEQLNRIRSQLEHARMQSQNAPIRDRQAALSIIKPIEETVQTMSGILATERERDTQAARATGVVEYAPDNVRRTANQALTRLKELTITNNNGDTQQSAATYETLRRLSGLTESVFGSTPHDLIAQITPLVTMLESKRHAARADDPIIVALREARDNLR